MKQTLIDFIKKNRISSVEVADALEKQGVLSGYQSLNAGHFVVGELWYSCTWNNSNWPLHEQLESFPDGRVLFVDCFRCDGRALFGDIVSKYVALYKKAAGVVVNGLLRDAHRLRKEDYPIWCKGVTPLGCFNSKVAVDGELTEYMKAQKEMLDGSIIVADDSGCTIIEERRQTPELLDRLDYIELQEDIWYFCIDTLKMSTFETICQKKYLSEPNLLPGVLGEKLKKYHGGKNGIR